MTERHVVVVFAGHRVSDRLTPGELLLHPIVLASIGLIIVNDRVLKHTVPGVLTGKLSDVAGMVFFPLLLVSLAESALWVFRRHSWALGPAAVVTAATVVGVSFVLTKTWHPAAAAYRSVLGYVFWPAYAVVDLVRFRPLPSIRRFDVVQDLTDLVALAALVVPVRIARSMRGAPQVDHGRRRLRQDT